MKPLVEVDTIEVVITERGHGTEFVNTDGVTYTLRRGQRAHLPADLAARFARQGWAEFTTFIRAFVDNLSAGSAGDLILSKGDVAAVSPDRAARLCAEGLAEMATGPATVPRPKADPMAALTQRQPVSVP